MSIEDALVEELINEIRVEKLMIGQGGRGVFEESHASDSDVRIEAPFLQLALTRLWNEELHQGSQVLRLETLQALGGAGRIVRTHMDSAMNALSPEEQDTQQVSFAIWSHLPEQKLHTQSQTWNTMPVPPALCNLCWRNLHRGMCELCVR